MIGRARLLARAGDATGVARLARLIAESTRVTDPPRTTPNSALAVHVTQGDRVVWLRPLPGDLRDFERIPAGGHRPPPELGGPFRHIAVLGARTGLTLADLGDGYPESALLGLAEDSDDVVLARRNVEHLGPRARVVEGSPLDAALDEWTGGVPVDFLLVDIGPRWRALLDPDSAAGDWAGTARGLRVVVGPGDLAAPEAVPLLEKLGYRARWVVDPAGGGTAVGVS